MITAKMDTSMTSLYHHVGPGSILARVAGHPAGTRNMSTVVNTIKDGGRELDMKKGRKPL
jgi:hypothetical protein